MPFILSTIIKPNFGAVRQFSGEEIVLIVQKDVVSAVITNYVTQDTDVLVILKALENLYFFSNQSRSRKEESVLFYLIARSTEFHENLNLPHTCV